MTKQHKKDISLTGKAYENIKSAILHLEIKPGEKIPEEKMAGLVNGSRTPVREALRRLSEEGLVNIFPRRFSEVARYDDEAIRQIGVIRLSQDILAGKLAMIHGSDSDFQALARTADMCEQGAKKGHIYERIAFDNQFHLSITEISKNQYLIQNQKKLYLIIHLIQIVKYTNVESSMAQIGHHKKIVDALFKRDFSQIRELICEHLQSFYQIDQGIIDMYLGN